MPGSPRYALATPAFPFRALAALAGRAPLGGARESALATLIAARLVEGVRPPIALAPALRLGRAEAAHLWMSSVALPAPVRATITRLIDVSSGNDLHAVAAALARVIDVTAPFLDKPALLELEHLSRRVGD